GTLSGNPIAMIAGFTLLNELKNQPSIYNELEGKGAWLAKKLSIILEDKKIPHQINRIGSMMSIFFSAHPIVDFKSVSETDIQMFNKFFHHMLDQGIYLPPSAYESWFLSNALSSEDIDKTLAAASTFNP
ncbi:MAG: aminotransferase class III-fold pyridoxal phosphate-dependent enzyme, partial [Ginsengibacter sp.]